jgi:hypothetical protein
MKFRSLVPTILISLMLLGAPSSHAQDVRARIYGGEFATLYNGPVALIVTSTFLCTGILVGSREVLTAAHCTAGDESDSEYQVFVGGGQYGVSTRYYNGDYDPSADDFDAAPYDLGILLLNSAVTGTSPIPVLVGDPVGVGESTVIYGYGANELSGLPDRDPRQEGKVGQAVIINTAGGLLTSNHLTAGASVCGGDSGGPMIQSVGGRAVVVGTLSVGLNTTQNGFCYLAGDGEFDYVNLQSSTSRSFLANFSGITYLAADPQRLRSGTGQLVSKIKSASRVGRSSDFVKRVSSILAKAKALRAYASGSKATVLNQAIRQLGAAAKARSLASGKRSLRKALSLMQSLYAMS